VRDITLFVGPNSFYSCRNLRHRKEKEPLHLELGGAVLPFFLLLLPQNVPVGLLLFAVLTALNLPNILLGYEYATQLIASLNSDKLFRFNTAGLEHLTYFYQIAQFLIIVVRIVSAPSLISSTTSTCCEYPQNPGGVSDRG
jgi:hypothetical protein